MILQGISNIFFEGFMEQSFDFDFKKKKLYWYLSIVFNLWIGFDHRNINSDFQILTLKDSDLAMIFKFLSILLSHRNNYFH